jgi:hypothetical protein
VENPREALIEFARSMPTTMRDTVLAVAVIGFDRLEARPDEEFLLKFEAILNEVPEDMSGYRCAMMAGLLDLALERDEAFDHEKFLTDLGEKHENDRFKEMALHVPLRDRHWQEAARRFRALRAGALSPRSIWLWNRQKLVERSQL